MFLRPLKAKTRKMMVQLRGYCTHVMIESMIYQIESLLGKNIKDDVILGSVLKKRLNEMRVIMPVLGPLPPEEEFLSMLMAQAVSRTRPGTVSVNYCKQFWKVGEFEVVLEEEFPSMLMVQAVSRTGSGTVSVNYCKYIVLEGWRV
ncbi:uncharacterized protein LOC133732567 [Rosa rugosa]|uniref:uncharacterized protein LOC133732567 n=1 Tax=Rosa rugosa TaxID=74645 RepID=UPI002B415493|nr:uncharacterized protein LOC133732567 [Rosa rugosa]